MKRGRRMRGKREGRTDSVRGKAKEKTIHRKRICLGEVEKKDGVSEESRNQIAYCARWGKKVPQSGCQGRSPLCSEGGVQGSIINYSDSLDSHTQTRA